MSRHRVIVVDDDESIQRIVQTKLDKAGISADTAASAEEGLKLMRDNLYTVVISDIHMPGMDGPEMIAHLKQVSPSVQVIMLTTDSSFERVLECLDRGAIEFFAKESSQLTLMAEAVREALQRGTRWASLIGKHSGQDRVPTSEVVS